MKGNTLERILLGTSITAYFLLAASFVVMPLEGLGVLPGILFWGGLLLGSGMLVPLEIRRRRLFAEYNASRKKMQKPRFGLLSFCSNRYAKIVDYFLAVSLVVTVVTFIITQGYGAICFILLGIDVFAFCMHCILNGRIYFHICNQHKVREVLEKRRTNSKDKGERE